MAVDLGKASLRLYRILEHVGVSEEMRLVHRQAVIQEIITTVMYGLNEHTPIEIYNFGSFNEGTATLDMGSDIDEVHCYPQIPVVADVREAGVAMSQVMIQDAHTFPGYVKLQPVVGGEPAFVYGMEVDKKHIEPDVYGRMCRKPIRLPGKPSHSPAIDMSGGVIQGDLVPALKCLSVPDSARQWLKRRRHNGWPSRHSLDRMAAMPHLVVGVGHPFSRERDIEWRLSYSFLERELMFSLNHTQHQSYVFMKMTKKNIIEPAVGEESITSYHCKTALFWAIENTRGDMWKPDMLLNCICVCFWYLKHFALNINCPNFFNPECNLFEREVFVRLSDRLSSVINLILRSIPDVATLIKCSSVGSILRTGRVSGDVVRQIMEQRYRCNVLPIGNIQLLNNKVSQLSHECSSHDDRVQKLNGLLDTWSREWKMTEHTEEQTEEARQFLLPCVHFRLATCLAAEGLKFNKGPLRNQLLRPSAEHLRLSRDRDMVTSRLTSITVVYKLGYFGHCERLLEEIRNNLKPYVMSYCMCSEMERVYPEEFCQWALSEKPTIKSMLTSAFVTCLTFLPSERELVPEPLLHELDRSRDNPGIPSKDWLGQDKSDWVSVDGKVYLYVLQYLVFSQLNKPVQKQEARDNLKLVIDNDPNLRHKDTAFNVLGWMYSQEGAYMEARRCWRLSLDIRPHHNAAIRHWPHLMNKPTDTEADHEEQ